MPLEIAEKGVLKAEFKSRPVPQYMQTRPGLLTREVDVQGYAFGQIQRLQSLAGELQFLADNLVAPGKGFESADVKPIWDFNAKYIDALETYRELMNDFGDDPELQRHLERNLGERLQAIRDQASDILLVIEQ